MGVGPEWSANGQWWMDHVGKTLVEGSSFQRVGSRQLTGLLISARAGKNLRPFIGDVDAAALPYGFGRAIGNKVEGLVLDHGSHHPDMKRRAENCYILICNVSLEYEKSPIIASQLLLVDEVIQAGRNMTRPC